MVVEELLDGCCQVQFGYVMGMQFVVSMCFEIGFFYVVFFDIGLNGCVVVFQWYLCDWIIKWFDVNCLCFVYYNCWEVIYFDYDMEMLKFIVDSVVKLGVEWFVLDDGWFGKCDDDIMLLGDWDVDLWKYLDGFGFLVDYIYGLGMWFGIWFEFEMVNFDSDLYWVYLDWVFGWVDQIFGWYQMVLDMFKVEVCDYLFDKIVVVLIDIDVDYIKWDYN